MSDKIWFRQSVALHGTHWRQDVLHCVQVGNPVVLVPEPENQYDSNAIQVLRDGVQLGYIPKILNVAVGEAEISSATIERVQKVEDGTDLFCVISVLADRIF